MPLPLTQFVKGGWITIVTLAGSVIIVFTAGIYFGTGGFPLGTGSYWTYQVYASSLFQAAPLVYDEVSSVAGLELCGLRVCYIIKTENSNERYTFWVSNHWLLVKSHWESKTEREALDLVFNPGVQLYEKLMDVGSSWKWDAKAQVRSTRGDKVSERETEIQGIERQIISKEVVNVPAGDFEVLVVEQRDDGVLTRRVWYSKEVGEAVRFEFPGASPGVKQWGELKSYQSRQPSSLQVLDLSLAGLELKYIVLVTAVLGIVKIAGKKKSKA